ncbi:MAG: hypothetical protein EBX38_04220 [Actinobacteria bacterium]|nr:hypothetical protein [Actinomycetota bacterium]
MVGLQQPSWIRQARIEIMNRVAPESRNPAPVDILIRNGSRLCVLASDSPHFDDRQAGISRQNQTKTQQLADFPVDRLGRAVRKTLRAVATLQQKAATDLCLCQLTTQGPDFTG